MIEIEKNIVGSFDMDSGTYRTASVKFNSTAKFTIPFSKPFKVVPNVSATATFVMTSGTFNATCTISNITVSGFDVTIKNDSSSANYEFDVLWHANAPITN